MIILHRIIPVFFTVLLLGAFLSLILSWPIMALWNGCLIGSVDGVHEITWLQAWGLSLLSGFLFRSHAGTKD